MEHQHSPWFEYKNFSSCIYCFMLFLLRGAYRRKGRPNRTKRRRRFMNCDSCVECWLLAGKYLCSIQMRFQLNMEKSKGAWRKCSLILSVGAATFSWNNGNIHHTYTFVETSKIVSLIIKNQNIFYVFLKNVFNLLWNYYV